MDRPVDVFGCSDALEVKLIHEVAKEVRQAAASADKVATEVRDASGKTTELQAMLVNGVKATMLPLLNYASDVERLRLEAKEGNGG
jgi:enoyl-CoA hydratase/carnithine racemase